MIPFILIMLLFPADGSQCAMTTCGCSYFTFNDYTALLDLKANLYPNSEGVLSDWQKSLVCSLGWSGVCCDKAGNVIEINLGNYQLLGSIAASLGNLSALQFLNLSSNALTGSIPDSISMLKNLLSLDLSTNNLTGVIPSNLGNLSSLRNIYLFSNQLSGPIPPSLGKLASIQTLSLYYNQLNGFIPPSLGGLRQLQTLFLGNNRLTGSIPPSLGLLVHLQYLHLGVNRLTGQIPSTLTNLTSLITLYIFDNSLAGSIPSTLGSLTKLQVLDLSFNQFNGTIPDSFGNLTSLQELYLYSNQLSGFIPPTLNPLVNLQYLDFSYNQLSGKIPLLFTSQQNLQSLDFSSNQFSGSIPPFQNLSSLQYMNISNCQLSGLIPTSFGSLAGLQTIDLSGNQLSGPVPSSLSNLSKLQGLYLYSNQLNGSIPSSLGSILTLQYLFLYYNQFTGTIPSTLVNLRNLQILYLGHNMLSGSIPENLGTLVNLTDIHFGANLLTGSIPSSIGNLSNLQTLYLYNNSLSGAIPASLGLMTSLLYMDLGNNSLVGIPFSFPLTRLKSLIYLSMSFNAFSDSSIPFSIGSLAALQTLQCRSCRLIGSIPPQINNLVQLSTLDLSVNSISGPLYPTFLANSPSMSAISISGSALTGAMPSFSTLPKLAFLDLSFNQFTSLQTLPGSIVSLDLSGNNLIVNLTAVNFSALPFLDILHLDSNSGVTGAIPALNASVLTLSNTNVSGEIPVYYFSQNSTSISFFNTPACAALPSNVSPVCQEPLSANMYSAPPPCAPSQPCAGTNLPNPYLEKAMNKCICSGYANITLSLLFSPFSVLTLRAATLLQQRVALLINLDPSTVLINSALTGSDGTTYITLFLFGTSQARPSDAVLSRFLSTWAKKPGSGGKPRVFFPLLGFIEKPEAFRIYDYYQSPAPPAAEINANAAASAYPNPGRLSSYVVASLVVAGLLVCAVVALAVLVAVRQRQSPNRWLILSSDVVEGSVRSKPHFAPYVPLETIVRATCNFSLDSKLGAGGYGDVFRGTAPDGSTWAVKRARNTVKSSSGEFEKELDILSKVSHANVVKLLGYCSTEGENILIYEFMNSGNLKQILSSAPGARDNLPQNPLTFLERVEIARGAAEGLNYLHCYSEEPIIHRDVKSDNILLNTTDKGIQAKIADFGLLKSNTDNFAELAFTRIAGTTGYIDPEYFTCYKVTRKSDVYSFGVVLLELITGLPPIIREADVSTDDDQSVTTLANWVQPFLGSWEGLVDKGMGDDYDKEAMDLFVKLAKACVERSGKYRPFMTEVCFRLHGIKSMVQSEEDGNRGPLFP